MFGSVGCMRGLLLGMFLALSVFICSFTQDGRIACVYPTGGMDYSIDESKPMIGFTVPFKPSDCAVNQGKKGDGKWHETPCDMKTAEAN